MAKDLFDFMKSPLWDELCVQAIPANVSTDMRKILASTLMKCAELSCNESDDVRIKEKTLKLYRESQNVNGNCFVQPSSGFSYECWTLTPNRKERLIQFHCDARTPKEAAEYFAAEKNFRYAFVGIKGQAGTSYWLVESRTIWWAEPMKDNPEDK